MKVTIKRATLPQRVTYSGRTFEYTPELTAKALQMPIYYANRANVIFVEVFSKKLAGKTDLHGQPYKPQRYVFTAVESKNL